LELWLGDAHVGGVEPLVDALVAALDQTLLLKDPQVVGEGAVVEAQRGLDGVVVVPGVGHDVSVDLTADVVVQHLVAVAADAGVQGDHEQQQQPPLAPLAA